MDPNFFKTSKRKRDYQKNYQKLNQTTLSIKRKDRLHSDQEFRSSVNEILLKSKIKIRMETLSFLGGKCKKCGFSDWRALQVDHINGGGHLENKLGGHSRRALLNRIRKSPKKYQILCANCNWIKRYENNECGRKEKGQ